MQHYVTHLPGTRLRHKCLAKLMIKLSASSAASHLVDASFPTKDEIAAAGLQAYVTAGGANEPPGDPPADVVACVLEGINVINAEFGVLPGVPAAAIASYADFMSQYLAALVKHICTSYLTKAAPPPEPLPAERRLAPLIGAAAITDSRWPDTDVINLMADATFGEIMTCVTTGDTTKLNTIMSIMPTPTTGPGRLLCYAAFVFDFRAPDDKKDKRCYFEMHTKVMQWRALCGAAPLLHYTKSIDYTLAHEGDAIRIVERLAANDWKWFVDNFFLFCRTEEEASSNTVIKTVALKEKRRFDCHLTISQLRFGLDLVVSLLSSLFPMIVEEATCTSHLWTIISGLESAAARVAVPDESKRCESFLNNFFTPVVRQCFRRFKVMAFSALSTQQVSSKFGDTIHSLHDFFSVETGPVLCRTAFTALIHMGFQHDRLAMFVHTTPGNAGLTMPSASAIADMFATPDFKMALAAAAGTAATSAVKSQIAHTPLGLPGAPGTVPPAAKRRSRSRSPINSRRGRSASPAARRARSRSRSPRRRRSKSKSPPRKKSGKAGALVPTRANFNTWYKKGADNIFKSSKGSKVRRDTYECADQAYRQSGTCYNQAECEKKYNFLHGPAAKKAGCRLSDRELKNISTSYNRKYKVMPGHLLGNYCRKNAAPSK